MPEQPQYRTRLSVRQLIVFAMTALVTMTTVTADDLEVYNSTAARPKVLFLLDTSGSMGHVDLNETDSRLKRMTDAMSELLASINGVDIGLMRFSHSKAVLIHPVVNVDDNRDTLNAELSKLKAEGGTPTVAAMVEAKRYLSGDRPYRGRIKSGFYQQPSTNQCESNHVVLLTDGEPTKDSTVVQDLFPILGACGDKFNWNGRGICGPELATHLATIDQFTNIPKDNFITTHSIGFNITNDWVKTLAANGGGLYREAKSKNELLNVFRAIINNVQTTATTAAPTVSVNAFKQSRHRNELYYSFFQPGGSPRWEGNVKKYKLKDSNVVDYYDAPLIEAGIVSPTSVSLWSLDDNGVPVADGDKVASGGMAARQPANRRWYTDYGVTADTNGDFFAKRITRNSDLPVTAFAAADNDERDKLVGWLRGYDSIDRDGDSNTNEPNRYVADSIHSSPVLVSYQADAAKSILEEVLFVANNMGVLHAVNPVNGNEIWSYTPAELLPNTKKYIDNDSRHHIYGLDGELVADISYKPSTTLDYEADKVRLYLTQRRGGSRIFALDVSDALKPANPIQRLWTITGGIAGDDYRDLGQTWAKPEIIPVRMGCPTNCQVRDVLMFSGGYNTLYDDKTLSFPVNTPATGHGNAIYFADPDTGALIWSAGNGAHHDLDLQQMNDSIPASPVPVDTDADGVVNVLFYSDIAGNIWRIDLNQHANTATDLAIGGDKIAALNEPGQALRFFNQPDIVVDGTTVGASNFSIILGSGMRSSPTYDEPHNNRLFVVNDPWVFENPTSLNASTGKTQSDYRYARDNNNLPKVITPDDLWQLDPASTAGPTRHGFYKVLNAGEKVLQSTLTHSGRIFLTTYVPHDPATTSDPCAYHIGESRLYLVDLETGASDLPSTFGGPYIIVGAGIVAGPQIIDSGQTDGPDLASGPNVEKIADLLDSSDPDIFRRFFRTGWNELEP